MAAGDRTKQWGMVWVFVVLSIAVHVIDGASIYLGKPAPGVYSSPILLVVALALMITTQRARRNAKRRTGIHDGTQAQFGNAYD